MPSSKEERESAGRRRKRIKELVLERGITNRNEITRILNIEGDGKNWTLPVSRQVVYNDLKYISKISESDLQHFELDIISIYKKNIRELQRLIDLEKDPKVKSQLFRTQSTLIKDQHDMASKIALRDRPSGSGTGDGHTHMGDSIGKESRIVFGNVEVEE